MLVLYKTWFQNAFQNHINSWYHHLNITILYLYWYCVSVIWQNLKNCCYLFSIRFITLSIMVLYQTCYMNALTKPYKFLLLSIWYCPLHYWCWYCIRHCVWMLWQYHINSWYPHLNITNTLFILVLYQTWGKCDLAKHK